jgi:Fic family protein
MIFNYNYKVELPKIIPDKRRALFHAKRMLPDYVFDTSKLENNPLTFPEVKTLMDGITIGGHKISDVQQVLNIKDSWLMLLSSIGDGTFSISKNMFHSIHTKIARDEALQWGEFRTGSVSITGTEIYQAPPWQELDAIFDREIEIILDCRNAIEQAIRLFLWGALNQFYWDGNKRTARLMANGITISAGYGVFNIKAKDIQEFNTLRIGFYETKQADEIVVFLAEKCIYYIEN